MEFFASSWTTHWTTLCKKDVLNSHACLLFPYLPLPFRRFRVFMDFLMFSVYYCVSLFGAAFQSPGHDWAISTDSHGLSLDATDGVPGLPVRVRVAATTPGQRQPNKKNRPLLEIFNPKPGQSRMDFFFSINFQLSREKKHLENPTASTVTWELCRAGSCWVTSFHRARIHEVPGKWCLWRIDLLQLDQSLP